jgi:hypothetical protein
MRCDVGLRVQSGYMRVMRLYDPSEVGNMEHAEQAAAAAQSAAQQQPSAAAASSLSHSMG